MNWLRQGWIKLLVLLIVTEPSHIAGNKSIRISCGGPVAGLDPIIGCFASLGTTRYVNFENGKMRGPGGSSVIEKLNTRGCVFSFDLGVLVVPGYYQCGTVLPAEKNGTEYALFAAFNVSIPEVMKSRERPRVGVPTPTISITTQRDVEGHTNHTTSWTAENTGFTFIWVAFTTLGVGTLILAGIAAFLLTRLKKSKKQIWPSDASVNPKTWRYSYPLGGDKFSLPPSQDEPSLQDVPPPMELIPADSITRYITKCPSSQKGSCACLKSPPSMCERFV